MSLPSDRPRRYAVVVPVKNRAHAKSRLSDLGDDVRVQLASAFAADTVTAALECPSVSRVLVVTDDHELARSMSELGADVLPDGTTDDLNGTLVQAAAELDRLDPGTGVVALCADLPALRPDELTEVLETVEPTGLWFVADEQRVGTTALVAPDLASFAPAFGNGSRARHLELGAREVEGIDVPTLRRDVDTPADLERARELGVGARTSMVVTSLRRP